MLYIFIKVYIFSYPEVQLGQEAVYFGELGAPYNSIF